MAGFQEHIQSLYIDSLRAIIARILSAFLKQQPQKLACPDLAFSATSHSIYQSIITWNVRLIWLQLSIQCEKDVFFHRNCACLKRSFSENCLFIRRILGRGLAAYASTCHLDTQNTVFWQFGHPKVYVRICWWWLFLEDRRCRNCSVTLWTIKSPWNLYMDTLFPNIG